MLLRKSWTGLKIKLGAFAFIAALFVIFGNTSSTFAQNSSNMYEDPWVPASKFAVKELSKKEKAVITLSSVKKADFATNDAGLNFNMCLEVMVKKGNKKAVKQYAQTNVFRNDQTMAYILKSWALSKTPPDLCK